MAKQAKGLKTQIYFIWKKKVCENVTLKPKLVEFPFGSCLKDHMTWKLYRAASQQTQRVPAPWLPGQRCRVQSYCQCEGCVWVCVCVPGCHTAALSMCVQRGLCVHSRLGPVSLLCMLGQTVWVISRFPSIQKLRGEGRQIHTFKPHTS